jgi:glycosyltransferase involved in cell wall biosynthesis
VTAPTPAPVSVVIPYYRHAATIHRAVSSAFDQTLPPHEVIIVDDGSDDHESIRSQLDSIASAYGDRLVIVSLPANQGPSSARNEGWRRSTQPFVAFLDADDAWHHRKLEVQVPVMLAGAAPAISGHFCGVDQDIRSPLRTDRPSEPRRVSFRQMLFRNRVWTQSVMVRADVVPRFNPRLRHGEDYDLWLRIIAAHGPLAFIPQTLATRYKWPYGAAGLSGQLFAMEAGQAAVYHALRRDGLISGLLYPVLLAWGQVRFFRRIVSTLVGGARLRNAVDRPRQ